ncbi:hypothetical protein (plasmid) [Citrobacter freundii]|nr:hypothetical protein [Citrobacter freundii]
MKYICISSSDIFPAQSGLRDQQAILSSCLIISSSSLSKTGY